MKNIKTNVNSSSIGKFQLKISDFTVNTINVYYYIPPRGKNTITKVIIVMSGMKRNAEDYRDFWIEKAEQYNLIVLAPCFPSDVFPGARSYILGNLYDDEGKANSSEVWTFSIIPRLFDEVKLQLKLPINHYYLFGHSAGAQFVHRFLIFIPQNRVIQALAANAGWYTLLDQRQGFPYGLYNSPFQKQDLATILQKRLIIALGKKDIDVQSPNLRHTRQADKQGLNRFERGKYFFEKAKKISLQKKLLFNWQIAEIEGVGHSPSRMISILAPLLFEKKIIR